MSTLNVTSIKGRAGVTPSLPDGAVISGIATIGADGIDLTGGINVTGIATAKSLALDGTLSGVTDIDATGSLSLSGDITGVDNINTTGVITATTFKGDGGSLTGVSAAALGVANGSIGVGTAVAVQSDGKFTVVTGTNAFNGNEASIETQGYQHVDMAYAPDVDKVILKYVNSGDGYTYVKIGTPSADGKTVTWAAGTQPNGGSASGYSSMCYDTINNKVVVLFRDEGSRIDSVVGTISGTTINWGTIVNVDSATNHWGCGISFDSSTGKCIAMWYQNSSSYELSVGTVSGTSITWGSKVSANNGDPQLHLDNSIAAENGHFVIAGRSNYHVGSYSGTTITMAGGAGGQGTIPFVSGTTTHSTITVDPATNTYMMGGCKDGSSGGSVPSVFGATRSGTTLTFTSQQNLSQTGATNLNFCWAGADKKFFTLWGEASPTGVYSSVVQVTGTNTSMTDAYKILFEQAGGTGANAGVYNPDKGAVVAVWRNSGSSGHGYYYVEGIRNSNGTTGGFVGFSNAAYTNGQTAKVSIVGAISTNQVGLTTAASYYLKGDGTIDMSPGAGDFLVGNALSATNLLLR